MGANKRSYDVANQIRSIITKDPDLTYTQIGYLLGLSKQRIHKICQDYDIKKTPHQKGKVLKYDHWTAIKNTIGNDISYYKYSDIAKAYNIPPDVFANFVSAHSDNVLVKKFISLRHPKKSDLIRKEIRRGKLTPKQIAEKFEVRQSYIYDIRNHRMED